MAIHGHGGNAVVTVTRGVGDVRAHCQYASVGCSDSQTMVGVRTPVPCSWPRSTCWWSSHSWGCRGALTCTCTPRRATRRHCSLVSLGSVTGGWQHTRSSGAQFSASMVSFMAVVTLTTNPRWYTVSVLVVLATRPPITASTGYAGTAIGTQSLGAACHRGVGAHRRGARTALWRASHALRPGIPLRAGALSFRARSPTTRWFAVYRSPRWWYPGAYTVS